MKKGVGIATKSKEASSNLASYQAMKSLAIYTLQAALATICLFIQTQFLLVN